MIVKIPDLTRPVFTIWINGVKHSYPSGVEMEVPDDVAAVIASYEKAHNVQADPAKPPYSTKVSWNDLKDKPFGESETGGDTLTWDGNTDGKAIAFDSFVHVSDVVLTKSDFSNGANAVIGEVLTIGEEDVIEGGLDGIGLMFGEVGFCLNETEAETLGIPAGIYFLWSAETLYISSLTIPGYTGFPVTKKIEEKYLPNNHTRFYYVGDDYLYSDVGVNKVTVNELKTAAKKGPIIVQIGSNASMTCSHLAISIVSNDVGEYGKLTIWNDEFIALYTAEYTAS